MRRRDFLRVAACIPAASFCGLAPAFPGSSSLCLSPGMHRFDAFVPAEFVRNRLFSLLANVNSNRWHNVEPGHALFSGFEGQLASDVSIYKVRSVVRVGSEPWGRYRVMYQQPGKLALNPGAVLPVEGEVYDRFAFGDFGQLV